jgi:predicted amidohydrolase YtcJ
VTLRLAAFVVLWAAAAQAAAAGDADRIFIGGRIWTGERAHPWAEAVAVRGGVLLAVGSTPAVLDLKGEHTEVTDLAGRLVVPGFHDAHLHLMGGSLALDRLDLSGAGSLAEIQRRLAAYANDHPEAPWILGGGWAWADFPGGQPDRRQLDAIVADRPVLLSDRDGHTGFANSAALRRAGLTRDTPDPQGGVIVRDAAGEATGILKESAKRLVSSLVPRPGLDERYAALRRGMDRLASYGITSVQDASFDPEDLPAFERLLADGPPKVRVAGALPMVKDPGAEVVARYQALRARYASTPLRLASVKGFVDGVIDAKTAAVFEPYTTGGTGILNWTAEDLDRTVAAWDREGFQVLLHAVGDKAIHMALDAYERAARASGTSGRRHRVEHVELPALADLPRFKALGVVASTQALFANPDATVLQNFAVVLGPERAARADSFSLFDGAGAVQAFGSDWPVFSAEVLRGIYCAVTRMTPEGTPPGGWEPQGRIPVEAALRHFTGDAAYATGEETMTGTLAPGKAAAFVVLSEDILRSPPAAILKARVLLTVRDGRDTHRAKGF